MNFVEVYNTEILVDGDNPLKLAIPDNSIISIEISPRHIDGVKGSVYCVEYASRDSWNYNEFTIKCGFITVSEYKKLRKA